MGHDGTGKDWDIALPAGATDYLANSCVELRDLRVGAEMRLNKMHSQTVDGTVASEALGTTGGGEHLEGSARIHTATSAPNVQAIGALDSGGNAANVAIDTNATTKAFAEGAIWSDTSSSYVLQVYAAEAWHDVGYLTSTVTVTGSATGVTMTNDGTGDCIDMILPVVKPPEIRPTGSGIVINNSSTGEGEQVVNASTGKGIDIDNTGGGSGIYIDNDNASSIGISIVGTADAGNAISITNTSGNAAIVITNSGVGEALNVANSNNSGSQHNMISLTAANAGAGAIVMFNCDANSASGAEYLFNFTSGEAGELAGHTKTGNNTYAASASGGGTFTCTGYIRMKDDDNNVVYIPYGTIANT